MENHIRLLLVTKSTGGVASYIRMLLQELNQEKFDITVACLSENGKEFSEELIRKYHVKAFSLEMNRYNINLLTDAKVLLNLASRIRTDKYSLIHAHASKPGFLARMAAIGTGIPVIYSPHNFAFHEGAHWLVIWLTVLLERFAAVFTSKIIAVAKHERDLALRYGVGFPELYSVIPTGIDLEKYQKHVDVENLKNLFNIPINSCVIGSVGRLATPKLPLDFVNAASILHKSFPNWHFVWVGSGPLEDEAKKLTNHLDLNHVIHWLGHREDVTQIYQILDCFLLLSRWEANPLVILEAFASGIPVIAFDNLGTREVITESGYGILVPNGNVQFLVNSIREILISTKKASNPELGNTLSRQGFIKKYSLKSMISSIENVYLNKEMPLQ